jgi:dipeptidyl-peptidase-3
LFGQLLREVQRIKSEGDYLAGKNLVENYGVKVDPVLHKEALTRFATLNIAPFKGFLQPHLQLIKDENGNVINVKIQQPQKFETQMLNLGKKYSFLPIIN